LAAVEERTELRLERNRLQSLAAALERLAAIRLPEECRIGQARAHHAFVSIANLRGITTLDIGHGDEEVHQPAIRIADREVALVILHRRDRHFLRKLEIFLIEAPGERDGPLDQCRDFVEQLGVDDRDAADFPCGVRNDIALVEQLLAVARRRANRDLARRMEAMTARLLARAYAQELGLDRLRAEEHHDPMHGPHELLFARAPTHATSDR